MTMAPPMPPPAHIAATPVTVRKSSAQIGG